MPEFFEGVDIIQAQIYEIDGTCNFINDIKNASLQEVDPDRVRQNSERLESLLNSTNFQLKSIKKSLDILDKKTSEYEENPNHSKARLKIRKNVRQTLIRQYINTANKYKATQEDYKTAINNKVSREIKMIKPELKDNEIDEIIQNGDPNQFIQQALSGPINNQIQDLYNQVQDKYKDVKKLVRSVKQIQRLFEDMAVLIAEQGEILNRIEKNVKEAHQNIKEGNEKLRGAIEEQKKARKLKCIITIIVLVILIVFLLYTGLISI